MSSQLYDRLNTLGYRVGVRVLELMSWRNESSSKAPKREIHFLPELRSIHTQVWRAVFGKPADAIEKSVENPDECGSHLLEGLVSTYARSVDMVIDNDPPITRNISVPRDMSQLSCSSFTAGIVEAVLDGLGFVSLVTSLYSSGHSLCDQPARVTAHNTPTEAYPNRTTILIKLERSVLEREEAFKT